MPRLAANLSMMFQEHDFLDRFAAAAAAGFNGVEFLFPYDHRPRDIADRLRAYSLTQVLFNLPPGNASAGDRGFAIFPGREEAFAASVDKAIEYALATGCKLLHAMAGICAESGPPEIYEATYVGNLQRAADRAAPYGITVLIEPLNARDMPGYYLRTTGQAIAIIDRADRANLKLQLDLYHCAITEGDVATRIRALQGRFAHVQIAGVPDRHEPDQGEIHYPYLFDILDSTGYDGWVGCEYRPAGDTASGLAWAKSWGVGST